MSTEAEQPTAATEGHGHKEVSLRSLWVRPVIVLGCLALLSAGGYYTQIVALRMAAPDSKLIALSGRQRTLFTQISWELDRVSETHGTADWAKHHEQIEHALAEFDRNQNAIAAALQQQRDADPSVYWVPTTSRRIIGMEVADYPGTVRETLGKLVSSPAEARADIAELLDPHLMDRIFSRLDALVPLLETYTDLAARRLHRYSLFFLVSFYTCLTMMIVGVIMPMMRRMYSEMRRRQKEHEALVKQTAVLRKAMEELTASREQLRIKSEANLSMIEDLEANDLRLKEEIVERSKAQELLCKAHDELEQRVRDRTAELERSVMATQESEERFRSMADSSPVIIWVTGVDKKCTYVNRAWLDMTGKTLEQSQGFNWVESVHEDDRAQALAHYNSAFDSRKLYRVEFRLLCADGTYRWVLATGTPRIAPDGEFQGYVGSCVDINDHRQMEEKLQNFAYFDQVTGLPNRVFFMDRLKEAVEYGKRHKDYKFAVLFLDLDRFKNINDSMGHAVGDQLLRAISCKLKKSTRLSDIVSRHGGDEFVVLMTGIRGAMDAIQTAHRIEEELAQPLILEGRSVICTASVGIALSDGGQKQAGEIIRDADTAMYEAKSAGRSRYKIFDYWMHSRVESAMQMENDLRMALQNKEMELHFQPQVCLTTGKLLGFEALVRWNHPTRGLVPPSEFIPVAEETGLIAALDRWVFEEACRVTSQWRRQHPGVKPPSVSVNFSAKEFSHADLLTTLLKVLDEQGGMAEDLRIEFTETTLLDRTHATRSMLTRLKSAGFKLVMDDFGTGYSSLIALQELPIDILKIDRAFLNRIDQPTQRKVLETIVTLGHELGILVIIEGVEAFEQLKYLRSIHCDQGQGFYFSPPVNAVQAGRMIASNRSWNLDVEPEPTPAPAPTPLAACG